jgi:uncharacterized membrane protein
MDKKFVKRLFEELPELVSKGVISPETEQQLRGHYSQTEGDRRNTALIVFGVLGAALIGTGIILLLAHNWDEISRPVRAVLSIAPLMAAQLLAGWTIWRKGTNAAWLEGAATFLCFSVAASIALIGQTYHTSGGLDTFILLWMALIVPLVYLMYANVPALVYVAGITAWTFTVQAQGGSAYLFWPLAALLIPHFFRLYKENPYSNRLVLLSWVVAVSLCFAFRTAVPAGRPGLEVVLYGGLFALMYLSGGLWFGGAPALWQRPWRVVGAAGYTVVSLLLTSQDIWRNMGYYVGHYAFGKDPEAVRLALLQLLSIEIPVILVVGLLLFMCVRRDLKDGLLFGALPFIIVAGLLTVFFSGNTGVPVVLANLHFLGFGLGVIMFGIRSGRTGTVNAGMLLLAALVVARFFDQNIGFMVRGVAFIVMGICFLITNVIVSRRSKRGAA